MPNGWMLAACISQMGTPSPEYVRRWGGLGSSQLACRFQEQLNAAGLAGIEEGIERGIERVSTLKFGMFTTFFLVLLAIL
jgi:hypothetical protein